MWERVSLLRCCISGAASAEGGRWTDRHCGAAAAAAASAAFPEISAATTSLQKGWGANLASTYVKS